MTPTLFNLDFDTDTPEAVERPPGRSYSLGSIQFSQQDVDAGRRQSVLGPEQQGWRRFSEVRSDDMWSVGTKGYPFATKGDFNDGNARGNGNGEYPKRGDMYRDGKGCDGNNGLMAGDGSNGKVNGNANGNANGNGNGYANPLLSPPGSDTNSSPTSPTSSTNNSLSRNQPYKSAYNLSYLSPAAPPQPPNQPTSYRHPLSPPTSPYSTPPNEPNYGRPRYHDQVYNLDASFKTLTVEGGGGWPSIYTPPSLQSPVRSPVLSGGGTSSGYRGGHGQSQGHGFDDAKALWVGNLPPNVTEEEIRMFFGECEIVSVANLVRSRCAFLNLRSEPGVHEAVRRYNDTNFNGCLIVCRPRLHRVERDRRIQQEREREKERSKEIERERYRYGGAGNGMFSPIMNRAYESHLQGHMRSPYAYPQQQQLTSAPIVNLGPGNSYTTSMGHAHGAMYQQQQASYSTPPPSAPTSPIPPPLPPTEPTYTTRYFILKSLSPAELEQARLRSLWATQRKNEPILNRAFGNTKEVLLVFSANKSGEFYGYARMEGPIEVGGGLRSVIDTYRFPPTGGADEKDDVEGKAVDVFGGKWGTAFRIKWVLIQPLPFTRVKHLRNSWNANKQIKVSRDGTEIETTVGRRLIQEFHEEVERVKAGDGGGASLGPSVDDGDGDDDDDDDADESEGTTSRSATTTPPPFSTSSRVEGVGMDRMGGDSNGRYAYPMHQNHIPYAPVQNDTTQQQPHIFSPLQLPNSSHFLPYTDHRHMKGAYTPQAPPNMEAGTYPFSPPSRPHQQHYHDHDRSRPDLTALPSMAMARHNHQQHGPYVPEHTYHGHSNIHGHSDTHGHDVGYPPQVPRRRFPVDGRADEYACAVGVDC
ncbi:hypothetical protein HDV00_003381 [Rhizophlyctis rosea]|nr:hypothetical protein HDV00_003381 [Rhizophlyctis rosea]